jgi:hypothetical protein
MREESSITFPGEAIAITALVNAFPVYLAIILVYHKILVIFSYSKKKAPEIIQLPALIR